MMPSKEQMGYILGYLIKMRLKNKSLLSEHKPHYLCSVETCNPICLPDAPNVFLCSARKIHICTFMHCELYRHNDESRCPISGLVLGKQFTGHSYSNPLRVYRQVTPGPLYEPMGSYITKRGRIEVLPNTTEEDDDEEEEILSQGNVKNRQFSDINKQKVDVCRKEISRIISSLFWSPTRASVNKDKNAKYKSVVEKKAKLYRDDCLEKGKPISLLHLAIINANAKKLLSGDLLSNPPRNLKDSVSKTLTDIVLGMWKKYSLFKGSYFSVITFTITILYMLRKGLVLGNGVQVIPHNDFVRKHMPKIKHLKYWKKVFKCTNKDVQKCELLIISLLKEIVANTAIRIQDIVVQFTREDDEVDALEGIIMLRKSKRNV